MDQRIERALLPCGLMAAWVATGCSDLPSGPDGGRAFTQPVFAAAATDSPALDQHNGTVGGTGNTIAKGFNPTNPRRGSAIVATFFWFGATQPGNVIAAVHDHLANGAPVGNGYTLIDYVSAGGVSMATYLATDVRGFPDPCCAPSNQDSILVVQADLSETVPNVGVALSAWTGISADLVRAVGAHRSDDGTGSSVTTTDPDTLEVGAGGPVYAVTLSNARSGTTPPAGFVEIDQGSDLVMKGASAFTVPASAGPLSPQWTWYYDPVACPIPCTWMTTALALHPASQDTVRLAGVGSIGTGAPAPGSDRQDFDLDVASTLGGRVFFRDWSVVRADGSVETLTVTPTDSATAITAFHDRSGTCPLPSRGAAFDGVGRADSGELLAFTITACDNGSAGGDRFTIAVPAQAYARGPAGLSSGDLVRSVNGAPAAGGNLLVATTTTGVALDPDGYTVTLGGSNGQVIATNGALTMVGLPAGDYQVRLSGLASNCSVGGPNPLSVTVADGGTATAGFSVTCGAVALGTP